MFDTQCFGSTLYLLKVAIRLDCSECLSACASTCKEPPTSQHHWTNAVALSHQLPLTGALVLFTVSQPNIETAHRFISLVIPQLPRGV